MSEDKRSALVSTKRRRGLVQASITRLEHRVNAYEIKEELTHADCLAIQSWIKKFETLDTKFRQHHYTIVELLDDEAVDEEQVALDDHDERVTDLIDRLQQLVSEPKEAVSLSRPADPSKPLQLSLIHI